MAEILVTAAEQGEAGLPEAAGVSEVVADKGFHSNETMVDPAAGFGAASTEYDLSPTVIEGIKGMLDLEIPDARVRFEETR